MPQEIAIAAIINAGKLLLGHRHPGRRWYPDCWDLIGGHVEAGETPESAIRRECREELTIDILDPVRAPADLNDPALLPSVFVVTRWSGEVENAAPDEHDALAWFDAHELAGLQLAHPSYAELLPKLLRAGRAPQTS